MNIQIKWSRTLPSFTTFFRSSCWRTSRLQVSRRLFTTLATFFPEVGDIYTLVTCDELKQWHNYENGLLLLNVLHIRYVKHVHVYPPFTIKAKDMS